MEAPEPQSCPLSHATSATATCLPRSVQRSSSYAEPLLTERGLASPYPTPTTLLSHSHSSKRRLPNPTRVASRVDGIRSTMPSPTDGKLDSDELASAGNPLPTDGTELERRAKDRVVEELVAASVLAITSIWPSCPAPSHGGPNDSVLPLTWFIKEVLRRSRTTCSTLQLALYYLHRNRRSLRTIIQASHRDREELEELSHFFTGTIHDPSFSSSALSPQGISKESEKMNYPSPPSSPPQNLSRYLSLLGKPSSPLLCGRRTFLSALLTASKMLQDINFSNKTWSKISSLSLKEINGNERIWLEICDWKFGVGESEFKSWCGRLRGIYNRGELGCEEGERKFKPLPQRRQLVRAISADGREI